MVFELGELLGFPKELPIIKAVVVELVVVKKDIERSFYFKLKKLKQLSLHNRA